jgi:hypothetical protein
VNIIYEAAATSKACVNAFILYRGVEAPVECPCPGEMNADGQIDLDDLQALAGILLGAGSPFVVPAAPGHCGNLNPDEQIDLDDLQAVAGILLHAGSPFIAPCQ